MSCLAHVFEEEDALGRLEAFTSVNGPAWYGLPANEETIRLVRRETPVSFPAKVETGAGPVTVFDPMFPLFWDVAT
jgi:dihydroorotase